MIEKKQLSDDQLEKATGGSHVSPSGIGKYVGKDMIFSYGIFGIHGPYSVHINSVRDTSIVNMTFNDPNNVPPSDTLKRAGWCDLGNNTWEWDYDDGCDTWLE